MTRYDLLDAAAAPALLPYLFWRRLCKGKYSESAAGMLGRNLPSPAEAQRFSAGSLWLHAVSYGEVNAARAIEPYLTELGPLQELPLVVSTVTETGQAHARKSFPQASITYFPADFSVNVHRFQALYNPRVFILLETELWPNFLTLARARGTLPYMINAKLSDRSFPRYRRFRKMLAPALGALRGVCTQTAIDAERFAAIGINPRRIYVSGNCKFDLLPNPLTVTEKESWFRELGLQPTRRWIVAGSTHPGEEELMVQALRELRAGGMDAGLILCPRHPERFAEVARLAERSEFPTARATAPNPLSGPLILVLDQMGVLARAYGLGEAAIVAGSFCPIGGHNLLEAAAHRIPVLFGPDMHSQREITRLFKEGHAGLQVQSAEIAATLHRLFTNSDFYQQNAESGFRVARQNQGSAARAAAQLGKWLQEDF